MQQLIARREYPQLKELVVEASRALACLNADRLEELALSCQALNRDLSTDNASEDIRRHRALVSQAREAVGEMAVLDRVLDVTRSNLKVMNRLRQLRSRRLEYRELDWAQPESKHGDN